MGFLTTCSMIILPRKETAFNDYHMGPLSLWHTISCRFLDKMNYSVDDDLYAAHARMVTANGRVTVAANKQFCCAYVGRRKRDYAFTHGQLQQRLGDGLVEFNENPKIFQEAMSRYRYIIRSPNRERLLK